MNNNVLVIGNGFDLAHGLNTRYDDFIKFIKDKTYDKYPNNENAAKIKRIVGNEKNGFINYFLAYINEVPGWVDLERLIKNIIHQFQNLFDHYMDYIIGKRFSERKMGGELFDALKKFGFAKGICVYKNAGVQFSLEAYKETYGLSRGEIVGKLRKELDDLVSALEAYFMLELEVNPIYGKTALGQIAEIDPKYVISFNYTNTYKLYGIKANDVFHVHGKLGSNPNNMVLGFNDEDETNLDFIYFKKYFQRIQKLTGYIDERKMGVNDKPVVYFYGHSMDKTDGDIIQKLWSMSNGFIIYKYNQEDYEQKVINLIEVFGKKEATRMIQDKNIIFVQCARP